MQILYLKLAQEPSHALVLLLSSQPAKAGWLTAVKNLKLVYIINGHRWLGVVGQKLFSRKVEKVRIDCWSRLDFYDPGCVFNAFLASALKHFMKTAVVEKLAALVSLR